MLTSLREGERGQQGAGRGGGEGRRILAEGSAIFQGLEEIGRREFLAEGFLDPRAGLVGGGGGVFVEAQLAQVLVEGRDGGHGGLGRRALGIGTRFLRWLLDARRRDLLRAWEKRVLGVALDVARIRSRRGGQ